MAQNWLKLTNHPSWVAVRLISFLVLAYLPTKIPYFRTKSRSKSPHKAPPSDAAEISSNQLMKRSNNWLRRLHAVADTCKSVPTNRRLLHRQFPVEVAEKWHTTCTVLVRSLVNSVRMKKMRSRSQKDLEPFSGIVE
ncbi:hypothetical protein AVEN_62191-1 [Araneus ventricosus]|uniref:Uncharacterized protein n=1 Tax=Araneus ventricosus TaxID=182803 RepID=A0A4Y2K9Y4_ARAVE|nr:hypothetical protein AVEN_62191-1 [Araneus ventricosus]